MKSIKSFTVEQARDAGDRLGIVWKAFDVEQFRVGMNVELEHGRKSTLTNVSNDDVLTSAKIALAHLNEMPDYYTRLQKIEQDAQI